MLNDAITILGEPPCDYDLRAMGSAGREEICPYSDLEWMILIGNNQNEDRISQDNDNINQDKKIYDQHISYFKTLASFIELQVVSLGETAAANLPVFTSLGTKNSSGFHIDTGGNPSKDDLIGCPEKMASLQKPKNYDQDYGPRRIEHTMLKTISLSQTTPDLFNQYQSCMDEILDKELSPAEKISALSALTVRERRALKLIEKRLADYKKAWNVHFEEHKIINIKEQYIEVLQHLIGDLALFYGIKETNTLDIIESLKGKQVFTEESSTLLKEAISFIYMLRVRLHLEYKEQKEEVYINITQGAACTEPQEAYRQSQNDLKLLHLRPNEIEKLSEIYWLVIRSIFFKVSKSFSGFKKQFTKISLPETSLEESLWCEGELEAKKLIPLSKYLAIYYTRIKENLEVHLNCYKKLSQKSIFDPLRVCYLQTLREEKQFSIADKLSFIPNRNGLRRSHVEAYQKLQDSLRQITTDSPSAILIKSPTLQTPLYLKPEFVEQILDIDGNIKREYGSSLHRVCRFRHEPDIDLHFKQKPNHPLMEYAVHDLTSRLTGEKTPSSELLRFEVTNKGKTIVYPVLVSQTIPGKNLKKVLAENPRYEPDSKCLTRMLLNAICIRPGDGKASNFVVYGDQIFCIDNDVAFVEPIVKYRLFCYSINFCSILFCLANQSLNKDVLQEFISIDIDLIFSSWLEALVQKEKLYLPLFVKEEKQLYEEDQENKFTPTILLPAGMITTLYTQIHILQQFLQTSLNDQLISIDLLDKLITLKGEDGKTSQIGGRIYEQYKNARSLSYPEERLKKATDRQSKQSLTTKQAMYASLGKIPTIEEIQKRKKFSIKKAQKEFTEYSLFIIEVSIIVNQKDKQKLSANFEKISQSGNPDTERQDSMLSGLDLFLSYQENKPISITLTNCAVLNNKKLSTFLHQELNYLDLRYSLVKADMVETISSNCTNLQELYLSGCDQLQAIENAGFISELGLTSSGPLNFPKLKVLHVDRCDILEKLKINAPNLLTLKANNNLNLDDLDMFRSCLHQELKYINLRCSLVKADMVEAISCNCPNLQKLYLSKCYNLQAVENAGWGVIPSGPLNFPELEVFHIDRCANLERLKINAPKLQVLKANNNLKLNDLNIAELCPSLKKLDLSRCDQLKAMENAGWGGIFSRPLNFPELEIFHIDRCDNLERLKINAPNLQVLKADNNIKLNDLNIDESCSSLKELNLSQCDQLKALEYRNRNNLNLTQLEVLRIARCANLERLKINVPRLRVLEANNDVKLKDLNMAESCSDLKELYLSECHQIQAIEDERGNNLNLTQLEVLHINKCDNLERLKLKAPNLQVLKVNSDVKLKDLNIAESCSNLKELYLSECHQIQALEDENGNNLNLTQLEVLYIDECDNLERLKIKVPKLRFLKFNNNVKLKELHLNECQIQALERSDKQGLNFPNLEVLHISKCDNLERLKINTPKLKVLNANNNVKLNDLKIFELYLNFKEPSLSECSQIQALNDKDMQVLKFLNLDVLHIAKCDVESLKNYDFSFRVLKTDNRSDLKEIIVTFPFKELSVNDCPLLKEIVFVNKAFGKKQWEKYFGEIGLKPYLPANIDKILNKSCSFWPNKKVKETHLLVLIPNTVNGNPFTMNYFGDLIHKPKSGYATKYRDYRSYAKEAAGDKSYPSHWVLMTKNIIPGSRGKSYEECCELIAEHSKKTGLPYELPYLLEATASILMYYVRTGERLFSDNPWEWTYSKDFDKDKYPLAVGGFQSDGLNVGEYSKSNSGVVGCRKL